ncbi:FAD-binding oxidoreductase [Deinococcus wulumuqiensis]|uniref:2-hydroxy-acid oxidase n=1 Tax=Deinococcus wulumuqiensis TaxID=980427 RepID=A0AAV4K0V3_9DEIO|nr:FAD-linked oxidase C-terminal domain-containing protein [Deinococcus wulumuqiensis]QII19756.1 FAD-binding protein [Deinococcus wulumuqiensis R12]GGI71449.1 2-hydroxy-acid oxidase [Deinococcus wulumuqiensis]GGP28414.1 2-hydroxy-acid oxidase [Deinococcus wulumuqiensis]
MTTTHPSPLTTDLLRALKPHQVLTRLSERLNYRYDAIQFGVTPLAVVLPESTADVVVAVKAAKAAGVPIIGRGAASGLSGGVTPLQESLVVSFTRMTGLRIFPERREAVAQPGVVTLRVSEAAKPHGLTYPPDPASFRTSTIGGNLGENAGGPMCFKYGVTGDYVKALEFVDTDGDIHRLTRDCYDLAGLLIGSEGTLGLMTEATLRLIAPPKFTRTLMCHFAEVGQAAEAVSSAIAAGAVPSKLEFMDTACTNAIEDYLHLGLPREAGAVLLVDTDGDDPAMVDAELELVAQACEAAGGTVKRAATPAEADALWQARRSISPALGRIRPQRMNEDIVVPRSALPDVVREIRALGDASPFHLVQFGHIGDGNLHPNIMFDPRTEDEAAVHDLAHQIALVAIRHGGVLSGEHGIGTMKRDFMRDAVDPVTLSALWDVKRALDPAERLNPGKILPEMLMVDR